LKWFFGITDGLFLLVSSSVGMGVFSSDLNMIRSRRPPRRQKKRGYKTPVFRRL
jgi:hypothetical protein